MSDSGIHGRYHFVIQKCKDAAAIFMTAVYPADDFCQVQAGGQEMRFLLYDVLLYDVSDVVLFMLLPICDQEIVQIRNEVFGLSVLMNEVLV